MIQLNLLPKVKLDYMKAKAAKRVTLTVASVVTASAVGITLLLFFYIGIVQAKYSRDLTKDINQEIQKLRDVKDLDKVLTIQNQLNSLDSLHNQKPVATRLFSFLYKITPDKFTYDETTVDFDTQAMSFKGSADSLASVNKFVDTLKFTDYKTKDDRTNKAFSKVVLTSFTVNQGEKNTDKQVTYQIDLQFDPVIFQSDNEVELVVPSKITTRSETEKPDLFEPASNNRQEP